MCQKGELKVIELGFNFYQSIFTKKEEKDQRGNGEIDHKSELKGKRRNKKGRKKGCNGGGTSL